MRINATREGVDPPPVVDTGDLGFPISRESGDCGQTTSTRCSLTLGIPAIGSARDSDTDYRSVSLVAGKSYVITLKLGHITDGFASAEEFTESVLELRDSTDSLEEETTGFGPRAATFTYAVPAGEGGTFYVKVKTSSQVIRDDYTLTVIEVETTDCLGTASTTCSMAVGTVVRGSSDTSEADYWSVTLEAGKTYVIDLKAGHISDNFATADADADPHLTLRDSSFTNRPGHERNTA